MGHIGLVACVSKKRPHSAEARDLYNSALFIKSRAFVERCCDAWCLLSAKYGLVEPTKIIEPYEETLNSKSRQERADWAKRVWAALSERLKPGDRVTILAGQRYREDLLPLITGLGCRVHVPMRGLKIGHQLQWLSKQIDLTETRANAESARRNTGSSSLALGAGGFASSRRQGKWKTFTASEPSQKSRNREEESVHGRPEIQATQARFRRTKSSQLTRSNFERHTERLYRALRHLEDGLGGKRLLSQCTGLQDWPTSGVYLFFEPTESRTNLADPRVVRVGTHGVSQGSKTTLWNRLHMHRGPIGGGGNHRGSVFRRHVGAAIQVAGQHATIASWGVGQSAGAELRKIEQGLEKKVSAHVGAMSVLWLAIEDEASRSCDRAYIERNLIGLLSGEAGPADPPSSKWLGRVSANEHIRASGLWNVDHVDYRYSPDFLDVLNEYVLITLDKRPRPNGPIAPRGWYGK